jgi:hypothetical protein
MLYGTDHPFGRPGHAAELIDALDCFAEDRELIYHRKVESLTKKGAHDSQRRGSDLRVSCLCHSIRYSE